MTSTAPSDDPTGNRPDSGSDGSPVPGQATSGALLRAVGLPGAVLLGLGSILGTGVFVSLAIGAGVAGAAVVPAVVLAALVATANGLSSAQLAAAHPVSGGTYEYGYRVLHPAAGFAAGWMFLVAKSASAATAALGCAGYLLHALGLPGPFAVRVGLGLLLVGGLAALVAGGIRRSNAVNAVIVSSTLLVLGAFVVLGVATLEPAEAARRLGPAALFAAAGGDPVAFLHGTALLFVAYTGYGRIATLGEEVRDPARTIPRAVVATLALTMALYASVVATAVASVGGDAFARAATRGAAAPLEVVAETFRIPGLPSFIAFGAITAMVGVLLNLLLGLSRVLLAMARRGDVPGSLARVTGATGSPALAVWTVSGLVAALVALGEVETTWTVSAFTVLVYYGLTNLAALRLPPESRRFPRAVSWFGLLACFGLAFFVPWPVWLTGLGVLLGGFLARGLFRRLRRPPG